MIILIVLLERRFLMEEQIIEKIKNKKIAILGFGREGQSTYQFIRKYAKEIPLTILDQNKVGEGLPDLREDPFVSFVVGDNYLENLEEYDCIIKTPGISLKDLDLTFLKDKITSQMELLLEVAYKQVIGITGTKGKSTTTSLIYEILKSQKENVVLAGNIGIPVLSVLEKCDKNTIFVVEMSSHQLEFLKKSPHIGIVLNLFQDHLDHAGTVEHYHEIKLHMFSNQSKEDFMIYCSDNETLKNLVEKSSFLGSPCRVNFKGNDSEAILYRDGKDIYYNGERIYNVDEKRNLLGNHNVENIMVALMVSELFHLNRRQTLETIRDFQTLDYRLQFVGEVESIKYYMDTLATIPEATIQSIEALKDVNTLIFGGMDRGIDYTDFCNYLKGSNVEHFVCMPTTGHTIGRTLPQERVHYVESLKEAVDLSKEVTSKDAICLLSPAASSYEYFKDYRDKGDHFKKYVLNK